MKDSRRMMLANAGLIAGLALGSIAIAASATGTTWATSAAAAGTVARPPSITAKAGGQKVNGRRKGAFLGLASHVAALTGMDVRDVDWQRRAGQSLTAIARAKGVASPRVVEAVVTDLAVRLEGHVASGRIDAGRKARALAAARSNLTARMAATQQAPSAV